MINEGLRRVRDLVNTDLTNAQAGTDNTSPQQTDSGLLSPVTSTNNTTSNQVSNDPATLTVTHTILTTEGNGYDLSEWELRINGDSESFNRTVTAAIPKVNTQEITRIVTVEVTQN